MRDVMFPIAFLLFAYPMIAIAYRIYTVPGMDPLLFSVAISSAFIGSAMLEYELYWLVLVQAPIAVVPTTWAIRRKVAAGRVPPKRRPTVKVGGSSWLSGAVFMVPMIAWIVGGVLFATTGSLVYPATTTVLGFLLLGFGLWVLARRGAIDIHAMLRRR